MAVPLMLCVLLLLHVISQVAGAGSTTANHPTVVIENAVAVIRVKDMAPMMLLLSTQEAFQRPWTTRGSGGASLKWTLTQRSSDLGYISRYTSKWVIDSLSDAKGSVALLLSVCEAG